MQKIRLNIRSRSPSLRLAIKKKTPSVHLNIKQGHSIDWYNGEYVVIPKFVEQSLRTRDKTMREDVTIREIPVEITINESGGNTLTIGG